ncbi:hypothetical protein AAFP32_01860 [Brevibacterium sp. CBA3109]|uniref:Uncharacterized protein n=1 Tax=Brevibacterium koreense TaxID=3140787 RepID=A0AAU7UM26_9MICO
MVGLTDPPVGNAGPLCKLGDHDQLELSRRCELRAFNGNLE